MHDETQSAPGRVWVSEPDIGNDALVENTGRGWDEWCDLITAWPGHTAGHQAVAGFLREQHDVADWWTQGITVGYERITGLRLPSQLADGTFTANKSMTLPADPIQLRTQLLDEHARHELFPGEPTTLRSKPTSKSIRLGFETGIAVITINAATNGRCKVTVGHEKLPDLAAATHWKSYWADWLAGRENGVAQG